METILLTYRINLNLIDKTIVHLIMVRGFNKFDEFESQLNSFCFFFRKEGGSCQFGTN